MTLEQAVPFFLVSNMEASVRFYVDTLGFAITEKWIFDGTIRWCWLQRDNAGLMLQDFRHEDGTVHLPAEKLGLGVRLRSSAAMPSSSIAR
jgi:lactoylglutathione lyase